MDSFKGSLTAPEACRAVREGLLQAGAGWNVSVFPLADGGEGTARSLQEALNGQWCVARVRGPLGLRQVDAGYAWIPARGEAVVEMAAASGLTLLSEKERDPLRTSTYGTGQLMQEAALQGAGRILLGIGGSATNDGGTGAARALGWRFLDSDGAELPDGGGSLPRLNRIEPPAAHSLPAVEVLCDVTNSLLGPNGASAVFGPQKGAGPAEVRQLEEGLRRLDGVVRDQFGIEMNALPGGGAAGGLGAGAVAFMNATLVSGIDTVMDCLELPDAVRSADWVLTGEGRFDSQSLQGKVATGVTRLAGEGRAQVGVLAGIVHLDETAWKEAGIADVEPAAPGGVPVEEAMAGAFELLKAAARRLGERMRK